MNSLQNVNKNLGFYFAFIIFILFYLPLLFYIHLKRNTNNEEAKKDINYWKIFIFNIPFTLIIGFIYTLFYISGYYFNTEIFVFLIVLSMIITTYNTNNISYVDKYNVSHNKTFAIVFTVLVSLQFIGMLFTKVNHKKIYNIIKISFLITSFISFSLTILFF